MILLRIIEIYLVLINLWSFILMGYDKHRARKNRRRVPEKELFITAAIGGSLGIWLAMQCFHHKTKHKSFTIGIPLIFILQLLIIGFCIYQSFSPR